MFKHSCFRLLIFLWWPLLLTAQSQAVRFDDFGSAQSWWRFHRDGTAAKDSVALRITNGYLRLQLSNPLAGLECNVGISDPQNIYGKQIDFLAFETRLRLLTPARPGSRGWGFWKAAKGGRASSLAWFMQQLCPDNAAFSWTRMGVIARGKTDFQQTTFQQNEWHVYRAERDALLKTTRFFVDGTEVFSTPGLAPRERMSFHLWIDNQVYSRKKGIIRQQWTGKSRLLVDYVKIETRTATPAAAGPQAEPVVLFRKIDLFPQKKEYRFPFKAVGDSVYILAAASAEYNAPFAAPDKLKLSWNGRRAVWRGEHLHGAARFAMLKGAGGKSEQVLKVTAKETPLLSYLAVLSAAGLHLLADSGNNEPGSEISFYNKEQKVLLCLAFKPLKQIGALSVVLDGQRLDRRIGQALKSEAVFGVSRLIFVDMVLQPGRHRLQWPIETGVALDRLIVFSLPYSAL